MLDALEQANNQAKRASQIIQHLRDFTKRGKLHLEEIDMTEVIHESIMLVKKEFPLIKVKVDFEPNSPPFFIMADKIQIEQVMINLLRNSIEAMRDNQTLNPELWIKREHYSNQHILVSVCDNGPGFQKNMDVNSLFQACITTKTNGLGVGLAISRIIIEAHGGRLTGHKNDSIQGACFQFILPTQQKNYAY